MTPPAPPLDDLDIVTLDLNGGARFLCILKALPPLHHTILGDGGSNDGSEVLAVGEGARVLKRLVRPKAITTDGLRSYSADLKELGNANRQEVGRWAINRAENSHLPFRRRERAMHRFRRMKTLQNSARSTTAFTIV